MGEKLLQFDKEIYIASTASVVGRKEFEGPIGSCFDLHDLTDKFGIKTWELAEGEMQRIALRTALAKASAEERDVDILLAGDLQNQCVGSGYGLLSFDIPYLGLYGACSTAAEGLMLAALFVSAGYAETAAAVTSSHNCAAERQYRTPLEYGAQRSPTAQWTVTGAGAFLVRRSGGVRICEAMPGIVVDKGIKDASNMGAAMAPAAADTLCRYFRATGHSPSDFDLILTGDLGKEGSGILRELCRIGGVEISRNHDDCGNMIFDPITQDVKSGGSGCGCSAAVFASYILHRMKKAEISDILLVGTGALLSAGTVLQKETIPGVAHLIRIQREGK